MLPNVQFAVDNYNSGQFTVTRMENGKPADIVHKCWDLAEAKTTALEMQLQHIAGHLFPYDQGDNAAKTETLVNITRTYFQDLLRILPNNDDAQNARQLVRQAFNFARTAILMDGMV